MTLDPPSSPLLAISVSWAVEHRYSQLWRQPGSDYFLRWVAGEWMDRRRSPETLHISWDVPADVPIAFDGLLLAVYPEHDVGLVVDGAGCFRLIPVSALRRNA